MRLHTRQTQPMRNRQPDTAYGQPIVSHTVRPSYPPLLLIFHIPPSNSQRKTHCAAWSGKCFLVIGWHYSSSRFGLQSVPMRILVHVPPLRTNARSGRRHSACLSQGPFASVAYGATKAISLRQPPVAHRRTARRRLRSRGTAKAYADACRHSPDHRGIERMNRHPVG